MDYTFEIVGIDRDMQIITVDYTPPAERSALKTVRIKMHAEIDSTTTAAELQAIAERGHESAVIKWEEELHSFNDAFDGDAMMALIGRQTRTLAADLAPKSRRERITERRVANPPPARTGGTNNDAVDV